MMGYSEIIEHLEKSTRKHISDKKKLKQQIEKLQAKIKAKDEEIIDLRNLMPNDVLVNYDRQTTKGHIKERKQALEEKATEGTEVNSKL